MDASEITYDMVAKKLREIVTSRGRKGTDKHEQVGGGGSVCMGCAGGLAAWVGVSCSALGDGWVWFNGCMGVHMDIDPTYMLCAAVLPAWPQVEMLAFLSSVAKGVPQKLEVMSQLVSSLFDLSPGISSYMKVRGPCCCWDVDCAGGHQSL